MQDNTMLYEIMSEKTLTKFETLIGNKHIKK